jgi:MFS family permease
MSGLHAGWSLGGVIGAVGIAAALALGVEPVVEAAVVAVLLFLLVLLAARHLGTGSVKTEGASGLHLPTRAVIPLAGLVVLIAFVEGGLTDWGGVYLDQGVGAGESLAALAYAAFSAGLFVGRIGGDWAKDRIGSIALTRWGMFLAAASIAVFLLLESPFVALAGMVAAGVGIANTVPQIFGAAARIPPGGPSLSAVFTTLTVAFMAGPAIIGTTSDLIGISGAFWLFAVASVVVGLVVPRVPTAETNPRFRTNA